MYFYLIAVKEENSDSNEDEGMDATNQGGDGDDGGGLNETKEKEPSQNEDSEKMDYSDNN